MCGKSQIATKGEHDSSGNKMPYNVYTAKEDSFNICDVKTRKKDNFFFCFI